MRTDIYRGVTFSQVATEPRDLQCIVAGDPVPGPNIPKSNGTRARQVTQRLAVDSIGFPSPAVERSLQRKRKIVTQLRNQFFS